MASWSSYISPESAFSGQNCAATDLNGNYGRSDYSRLISPTFTVPVEEQFPRLRFWHWFNINGGDSGVVQIRIPGQEWQSISETFSGEGASVWSNTLVDLRPFASQDVQICFLFDSDGGSTNRGWYIDNVRLDTGFYQFNNPEDWEEGFGDWYADRGVWQVGTPTSGPESAFSGQNCAATDLNGNYGRSDYSRLISPTFTVPVEEQFPRLRFWHWFNINGGDSGVVQIRIPGQEWQSISETFSGEGASVWSNTLVDLRPFASQDVQICFLFDSDGGSTNRGWYIDNVRLDTGFYQFNNPEDWEEGFGDWYADRGVWQVGTPTSGPESAFSGQNCAATDLNGNYGRSDYSRLISPTFTVPVEEQFPRLRFWHWFNINGADSGVVQIRIPGQEWQSISETFSGEGASVWSNTLVDLRPFASQDVQICFLFDSDGGSTNRGWYIDNVRLDTGFYQFNNPEDWEEGFGDWYADRGVWQVGTPTSGPESAFSGQNCAATDLNGNYGRSDYSRLISPIFILSEESCSFQLHFSHWFNINGGSSGVIQIKTLNGEWTDVSDLYSGNSGGWIQDTIDLKTYEDSIIQIAFLFDSDGGSTNSGWYIDSLIFPTDLTPRILPDSGHNVGTLRTQVFGGGFDENTQIRLTKEGEEDIVAIDSLTEYIDCVRLKPTFTLQSATPGLWDVVVSNQTVELLRIPEGFRILEPAIYVSEPKQGANIAQVTLLLKGAGFTPDMNVLLSKGGNSIEAVFYTSTKPNEAFATFDLTGVETGVYDISFQRKDGYSGTLENSFEVIEGKGLLGPNLLGNVRKSCPIPTFNLDHFLEWTLLAPAETRPDWVISIEVNFENTGPIDIPAPKRIFLSEGGAPIGFSEEELAGRKDAFGTRVQRTQRSSQYP